MALKYANNAKTTLNGAITNVATSITVTNGAVFPALGGSDYFYMTLEDVTLQNEIVKVTAVAGNVLTIVRAQNGTTAKAFANADKAEGRVVTGILDDLAALVNGVVPGSAFMALVDDTTNGALLTTLGISAYAQTLLDDANAGTALTTLGVSSFAQTLLDDTTASAVLTTLALFSTANTWTATQTFKCSGGNFQFLIDNGANTKQISSWFSSSDDQWNLQPRSAGTLVSNKQFSYNFTNGLWAIGGDPVMTRGATETVSGAKTFTSDLLVSKAGAKVTATSNTSAAPGYIFNVNGGRQDRIIATSTGLYIGVNVAGTERVLTLSSAGALGWAGTANIGPSGTGLLIQNTAVDYQHTIDKDNTGVYFSTNSGSRAFRWIVGGSTFMSLNTSGNLTAVDFTLSSDETLKKNFSVYTDALAKVRQLRGGEYTRISTGKREAGLMAQDFERAGLQLYVDNTTSTKTLKYPRIPALLVEAIKELLLRVEALEAK